MADRILLTGGTGFIGQPLCQALIARGYQLTVLSRRPAADVRARCGEVEPVSSLEDLRNHEGFHGIINLAGEGIADKRWSAARKQKLRDSRIALTNQLVNIARTWTTLPAVLVSGSAVGYYGDQGTSEVSEETPAHDEFTHQLCRDWEQAAQQLGVDGVRVCLSRTGVVVGPDGGFLTRMLPPFRLGLGGRLGRGDQYMPWVHRTDVVRALIWMLEQQGASGPYNVVSPSPVTNGAFTRCLGGVLKRPTLAAVPAAALKLMLGEMSRLLLTGQRAYPARLGAAGFEFSYTNLEAALEDALGLK